MEITKRTNKFIRTSTNKADEARERAREQREIARRNAERAERTRTESSKPAAGDDSFMVNLSTAATETSSSNTVSETQSTREIFDQGLRAFTGDSTGNSSINVSGNSNVSLGVSDSPRDVTINGESIHLGAGESLVYKDGEVTITGPSEAQENAAPTSQQAEENAETASTIGTAQEVAAEAETESSPNQSFDQSTSEGFVDSVYDGLLGRDADSEGADFWKKNLDSGDMSSAEVVSNILNSDEFKSHELDSEETVELLYETVFGREADAEGLAFHANNAREKGIDAVVKDFFASDEFKNREAAGQAKGRFAPEPVIAEPVAAAPSAPSPSSSNPPSPDHPTLEEFALEQGFQPPSPSPSSNPPSPDHPTLEEFALEQGFQPPSPSPSSNPPSPTLGPNEPHHHANDSGPRPIVLLNDIEEPVVVSPFEPIIPISQPEPEVKRWPH